MKFYRQVVAMVRGEGRFMVLLVLCSVMVAFTEGLGITILLPLFDSEQKLKIPLFAGALSYLNNLPIVARLYLIAIILGGLLLLRAASIFATQHLAMTVPSRIARRLALRLHAAYLASSLRFAGSRTTGEIHALVVIAPERAVKVLKGLVQIIVMFPLVAISIAVMMTMSWVIASFAVLTFMLLYFGVRSLLSSRSQEIGKQLSVSDRALSQAVFESVRMLVPTKLMNAQKHMTTMMDDCYQAYVRCRVRQNRINASINPLISVGAGAAIICILVGVATFSSNPGAEIPRLLILIIAMSRLPGPASAIGAARMQIQTNRHAYDEIEAFLAAADAECEAGGLQPPKSVANIEFRDVGFAYHEKAAAVRHLSFDIVQGTLVALVGSSGAGKSTVLNLLAKLYAPTQGSIFVNGSDLREFDSAAWRSQLGVVAQDMALFSGSIRDNIAFHRAGIDDGAVRTAASLAGIADFIETMPDDYDTKIGDGARGLSGGQKQRIMIARALAGSPQVLIFDEATSSLDVDSEATIQAAVEDLRGKVTIIWVSHRMHTVKTADLILVMERGIISALGTHETLVRDAESYRVLLRAEFVATDRGGKHLPKSQ